MNSVNYNVFQKNNRLLIVTNEDGNIRISPFYFEVRNMNNEDYLYIPSITDGEFIHSVLNNPNVIYYFEYPFKNGICYLYGNAIADCSSCDFDFVNRNVDPALYQLRLKVETICPKKEIL